MPNSPDLSFSGFDLGEIANGAFEKSCLIRRRQRGHEFPRALGIELCVVRSEAFDVTEAHRSGRKLRDGPEAVGSVRRELPGGDREHQPIRRRRKSRSQFEEFFRVANGAIRVERAKGHLGFARTLVGRPLQHAFAVGLLPRLKEAKQGHPPRVRG
jgi:hypothetical protein